MTNGIVEFLKKNPVLYFATVDTSGSPRVRPFVFMVEKDGKPYFCTSHTKQMYKEMQAHPPIEITTASPEFVWI